MSPGAAAHPLERTRVRGVRKRGVSWVPTMTLPSNWKTTVNRRCLSTLKITSKHKGVTIIDEMKKSTKLEKPL